MTRSIAFSNSQFVQLTSQDPIGSVASHFPEFCTASAFRKDAFRDNRSLQYKSLRRFMNLTLLRSVWQSSRQMALLGGGGGGGSIHLEQLVALLEQVPHVRERLLYSLNEPPRVLQS